MNRPVGKAGKMQNKNFVLPLSNSVKHCVLPRCFNFLQTLSYSRWRDISTFLDSLTAAQLSKDKTAWKVAAPVDRSITRMMESKVDPACPLFDGDRLIHGTWQGAKNSTWWNKGFFPWWSYTFFLLHIFILVYSNLAKPTALWPIHYL